MKLIIIAFALFIIMFVIKHNIFLQQNERFTLPPSACKTFKSESVDCGPGYFLNKMSVVEGGSQITCCTPFSTMAPR